MEKLWIFWVLPTPWLVTAGAWVAGIRGMKWAMVDGGVAAAVMAIVSVFYVGIGRVACS